MGPGGKPDHPIIQGKIERWHQSVKSENLLENYYLPDEVRRRIGPFVNHYNTQTNCESLNNPIPANVYHGRDQARFREREKIERKTMEIGTRLHCHAMDAKHRTTQPDTVLF